MRVWTLLPLVLIGAPILGGCLQSSPAPMPGSDRDSHGCIPSAGYSWCEAKQKCLRSWEENCTAPVQIQPAPIDPCANLSSVGSHDACYAALAARQSDAAQCDRIYDVDGRDACLSAFVASDASFCSRMVRTSYQDSCNLKVAYATNNSALCPSIRDAGMRDNCTSDLLSPCALYSDPAAAGRCEAFRQNNASFCLDDSCRFDFAKERLSLPACGMMTGERSRMLACRAVVLNDSTACTADNNSYRADWCYQLTAQALNDSEWCSYGQLGSPYRDECYLYFARLSRNASGCQSVYLETGRDWCYLNYSVDLDQPDTCRLVINSLNRNKCYMFTARTNGDATACNGLPGRDAAACYNAVVMGSVPLRDAASCAGINGSGIEVWKPRCFTTLAVQQRNFTICDFIDDSGYRQACLDKFA
ncbi:MAG: hypothetical protein M1530_01335 [Candidatus Marsarchaeota archaeon]|nr:hypothetical protein [Candidatus Marsarchaeota archaeon]